MEGTRTLPIGLRPRHGIEGSGVGKCLDLGAIGYTFKPVLVDVREIDLSVVL
jgi:hypothetical protein